MWHLRKFVMRMVARVMVRKMNTVIEIDLGLLQHQVLFHLLRV